MLGEKRKTVKTMSEVQQEKQFGQIVYTVYPFGDPSPMGARVERIGNEIRFNVDTSQPFTPKRAMALASAIEKLCKLSDSLESVKEEDAGMAQELADTLVRVINAVEQNMSKPDLGDLLAEASSLASRVRRGQTDA